MAVRDLRLSHAALCGFVMGFANVLVAGRWLSLFGIPLYIGVTTFQALYWGLFAAIYSKIAMRRGLGWKLAAAPVAWVSAQFLRTLGVFGCPFLDLAHTQANCLPVIQIASIAGPLAIDAVVCSANYALSTCLIDRERSRPALTMAACLVLVTLGFGFFSLRAAPPAGDKHKVAVLQGNITNDIRPIPRFTPLAYKRYHKMTLDAARSRPELVLWPETALPTSITSPGRADMIAALAKQTGTMVLAGGYDVSDELDVQGNYNALIAFDKHGERTGAYRKVQLVPFGEFVPWREHLPFIRGYGIREEDVLAAESHALLDSPVGKIGTSICFEAAFPQISRAEVKDGAEVLAVVSNDAWFRRTGAPMQHMMMSGLRAVENRRYVIRAASTGVSVIIDPYGRILRQAGLFQQRILLDDVIPSRKLTAYTVMGDWLAYLCLVVAFTGALTPTVKDKKRQK